jgi:hypothetical protein
MCASVTWRDALSEVPNRRESRKEKESGKQPGLRYLCTRGPRSSESDTEPSVLRQPIAMTGRKWTVKTTAGAVRIGKSRDCPGAPATLFEKLVRKRSAEKSKPEFATVRLQIPQIANCVRLQIDCQCANRTAHSWRRVEPSTNQNAKCRSGSTRQISVGPQDRSTCPTRSRNGDGVSSRQLAVE